MKFSAAVMALVAVAEAAPQPQGGLLSGILSGSGWGFVGSKTETPKYRSTAKRVTSTYGPIVLLGKDEKKSPGSMDPKGQAGSGRLTKGLCSKCTILSGHFDLKYENGTKATPATGVYIHHMLSFDVGKTARSPLGASSSLPFAAFIDRGEDSGESDTVFTSQDGTFNSGFHFDGGSMLVSYDWVNYALEKQNLFLELTYEYVDGLVGKDAGHTLKSVSGKIDIGENGAAETKSTPMKVSEDATIIWARGHLHAGGVAMKLAVNGKDICTSAAKYNDANVITAMELCPSAIPLKKGDTVVIRSVYDLTEHDLREATDGSGHGAHGTLGGSDVMGMFAMSYALDGAAGAAGAATTTKSTGSALSGLLKGATSSKTNSTGSSGLSSLLGRLKSAGSTN